MPLRTVERVAYSGTAEGGARVWLECGHLRDVESMEGGERMKGERRECKRCSAQQLGGK